MKLTREYKEGDLVIGPIYGRNLPLYIYMKKYTAEDGSVRHEVKIAPTSAESVPTSFSRSVEYFCESDEIKPVNTPFLGWGGSVYDCRSGTPVKLFCVDGDLNTMHERSIVFADFFTKHGLPD